jgi:hypothetical protein
MKSTHFITNNATTTLINHLKSFFHLSPSPAAMTLNQVTTIMIIAKKNANALIADRITKNTDHSHIIEFVNHSRPSFHAVN